MPPVIIKTSTPDANGGNPLNAYSLDLGSGAADVLPGVLIDPDALKPIGSGAGSVGLPISGPADLTVTGTVTNIGDTVQIALAGRRGVAMVNTDSGPGVNIGFDFSPDGGANWAPLPFWEATAKTWNWLVLLVPGDVYVPATVPATHVRARLISGASAARTLKLTATTAPNTLQSLWQTFNQTAAPALIMGGVDTGNALQTIIADGGYKGVAGWNALAVTPMPPIDANSNRQAIKAASTAAVAADPAAVVALSPNSPPATGMADTLFASGDVTTPGAGAAIATLTTPAAGTYRLDLTCFTYVGNLVASVGPDMELRKGAAVQVAKLGGISAAKDGTVTPGVAGTPSVLTNLRVTLDGSTNLSINATAGGTANYVAQLAATRMA